MFNEKLLICQEKILYKESPNDKKEIHTSILKNLTVIELFDADFADFAQIGITLKNLLDSILLQGSHPF
jgi:hypothetical protein